MADAIDLANDLIDNEISRALSKIRQNASHESPGTKLCTECGDKIPDARQQLGFHLCVPCAEEKERKDALFTD